MSLKNAVYYILGLLFIAAAIICYLLRGWREGHDPHPLFLGDWYRKRYLTTKPQNPL